MLYCKKYKVKKVKPVAFYVVKGNKLIFVCKPKDAKSLLTAQYLF
jgi:hypothetical protein